MAVDVAITARTVNHVQTVRLVTKENLSEMPLTAQDRQHLLDYKVDVFPGNIPTDIVLDKFGEVDTLINVTR